jgi:hypothetical protein
VLHGSVVLREAEMRPEGNRSGPSKVECPAVGEEGGIEAVAVSSWQTVAQEPWAHEGGGLSGWTLACR